MTNNQPKFDNLLHNSPPEVVRIINSRLAWGIAALNSFFSELASDSNYPPAESYSWQFKDEDGCKKAKPSKPEEEATPFQRVCMEPLFGDWANTFPAIIQPEVPPSVAGPYSEHPSPVTILEQAGTAAETQKPELPLEVKTHTRKKLHNDPDFRATEQNGGYVCDECLKFIKNKKYMRKHIRYNHTEKKFFKCSFCIFSKWFSSKGNLKQHMRRVHNIANK